MRGADGEWNGLAADLWRRIAADAGVRCRFEERDNPEQFPRPPLRGPAEPEWNERIASCLGVRD